MESVLSLGKGGLPLTNPRATALNRVVWRCKGSLGRNHFPLDWDTGGSGGGE